MGRVALFAIASVLVGCAAPMGPVAPGATPAPSAQSAPPSAQALLEAQNDLFRRACGASMRGEECDAVTPALSALWDQWMTRAEALRPLLPVGSFDRSDLELQMGWALRTLGHFDRAIAAFESAIAGYGSSTEPGARDRLAAAFVDLASLHLARLDFVNQAGTLERIAGAGRLPVALRTEAATKAIALYIDLERPSDAARVRTSAGGLLVGDAAILVDWTMSSADWDAWRSDAADAGSNHDRRLRAIDAMDGFVHRWEGRNSAARRVLEARWRITELRAPDGKRSKARVDALTRVVAAAKALEGSWSTADDARLRGYGVRAEWELLDAEIATDFDGRPVRAANTTPTQFYGQVAFGSRTASNGALHDLMTEVSAYEKRIVALRRPSFAPTVVALGDARLGDLYEQLWRAIQLQPPIANSVAGNLLGAALLFYRDALDDARRVQEPPPAMAAIRLRYLSGTSPAVAASLPMSRWRSAQDEQAFAALPVTHASAGDSPAMTPAPHP